MVGNNSSGSGSIKYGTTRDHTLHIRAILSSEEIVDFYGITDAQFTLKIKGNQLEHKIYRQLNTILSPTTIQEEIRKQYPYKDIHRRNNGYALDRLLDMTPFHPSGGYFNLAQFLCGSEGTLCLFSEITLNLEQLPPQHSALLIPHFNSIDHALKAVSIVMNHHPYACELMDKTILDCTARNAKYLHFREFVQGNPKALLILEVRAENQNNLDLKIQKLKDDLQQLGTPTAIPTRSGKAANNVWELRRAGLGLLANLPSEAKAVACIEDTAVRIQDLPAYISEFEALMARFNQACIYYAHAGAGEIHLRPILNLKLKNDREDFRQITKQTAQLVKSYNGALSGEHGDGRVRSEYLNIILGDKIVDILSNIKHTWDPQNIFNPGKIVDPTPMDQDLRYDENQVIKSFDTAFEFKESGGMLQSAEKCNGSGDCRKLPGAGGTMCPSYMASHNEKDTTRARANVLREFLTKSKKPFLEKDVADVLDLCLGCKGCASECPSNVDIAKLKSEFLHQKNKAGLGSNVDRLFATMDQKYHLAYLAGPLSYAMATSSKMSEKFKSDMDIHPDRTLPSLQKQTWHKWFSKSGKKLNPTSKDRQLILFCDEYTNYFDPAIGIAATRLFQRLGYYVLLPKIKTSARAAISKGYLDIAKKEAENNIKKLSQYKYSNLPVVGIEPSAILGFRDEYPALTRGELKEKAYQLKNRTFLLEEFILDQFKAQYIRTDQFDQVSRNIVVHTHCHQKALSQEQIVAQVLSIPEGHIVRPLSTGCCGMAGSFGFERSHYAMSQQVAELSLFPSLRNEPDRSIVVATGTSCRHQIKDGLQRNSYHTAQIMHDALV
ncbi:UNVERIFIED_CONTAM: hypothetical protein GTU68_035193 [Idotea baltica]|nr:hypothetical protein [Idotea baltica]